MLMWSPAAEARGLVPDPDAVAATEENEEADCGPAICPTAPSLVDRTPGYWLIEFAHDMKLPVSAGAHAALWKPAPPAPVPILVPFLA